MGRAATWASRDRNGVGRVPGALVVCALLWGFSAISVGAQAGAAPPPALRVADGGSAFQEDQRMNSLTLQFGTDAFAAHNRFGSAFTSSAQGQMQSAIDGGVSTGSTSMLLEMLGLGDLTGTNAPTLAVGVVNGAPVVDAGNPTGYNGNSDLDWWYTPSASDLDANGVPKVQLSGSIASNALTATGGTLTFAPAPLGSGPLTMSSVYLAATVDGSSAPLESTNYFPPGHVPSEQIPPDLVSFTSMSAGHLRGDISAASLAQAPVPAPLLGTGTFKCTAGYTASNSLLDVLVSGCTNGFGIRLVNATQPDAAAAVVGAGGPYTLVPGASHVVTSCKDKNGSAVTLAPCLSAAAYSAYFTFTTDRVIVPPPPSLDLTETAIGNPPTTQTIGTKFSVTDSTLDDGSSASTVTTQTRYYLSLDATKDAADVLLVGTRSVGPLAPSATSSGSTRVTIPKVPTDHYFVLACSDDTAVAIEANETNNCMASTTTILVTVPDLVVAALDDPPASAGAGSSFLEGASTVNNGNGSARASTTRFYLSVDKKKNAGDALLTGTDPVGVLAPGAYEYSTNLLTIPSGTTAGTYYLLACADDLRKVKESNEKNNCTPSYSTVVVT
jgi:hypothetical protein